MAGMPLGFADLLQRKYDLLQQDANTHQFEADTQRTGVNASARLNSVRAGLLPAESNANIGLTQAQALQAQAQSRSIDENTRYVGPLANASIFNTRAQGGLYGQQAIGESEFNRLGYKPASAGLGMPTADADFEMKLRSILKEGLGYH